MSMHVHTFGHATCTTSSGCHQRLVTFPTGRQLAGRQFDGGLRPSRQRSRARGSVIIPQAAQSPALRSQLSDLVKSPLYSIWLQGGIALGVLAAVDAGYSGDWSRIGAITKETEDWLKSLLPYLGVFHAFCVTVVASKLASGGKSVLWPVTKTAFVGGLSMFEVLLREDD